MYDVIVVGAGIVGSAVAWSAAERGLKVLVLERSARAEGASVRNFGMVWPVGQPAGERLALALRSRERWLRLLTDAGLWHETAGSIHLAADEDALAVMREFAERGPDAGYRVRLVTAREARALSPAAGPAVLGGFVSDTEVCVDPRATIAALPGWLHRRYGVEVRFDTTVIAAEEGAVRTAGGETLKARRIVVASGAETRLLFGHLFGPAGVVPCKLHMLRTVPQPAGFRIGPMVASGLTLRHYESFAVCPSLAAYRERITREAPELDRFGIHVMASQHGHGGVTIGDSHEYGDAIAPFNAAFIDERILSELKRIIALPDWTIAERWTGVYAKRPGHTHLELEPAPGVYVLNGTGGAGMTLSFGIADAFVQRWTA